MPFNKYKGYNLRNRIFLGFLVICLLSLLASAVLSFMVLTENAKEQSLTDQQRKSDALMASLDYAVSHKHLKTEDLQQVLGNKIFEISDISKADIVIYDLKGDYLLSNKSKNLVEQKNIPENIRIELLNTGKRVDVQTYDPRLQANIMSSYMVLKNNMLEPIAMIYFPYYHSDSSYFEVFNKYVKYLVLVNLIIVVIAVWLSWIISKNLTNALMKFSEHIKRLTLFEGDMKPIRYYKNDELNTLVRSYNRMVLQIQDQKERLAFSEKEKAWREMAKQVAHEVKNPLTPMKLTIQNFKRKFNPNDPQVVDSVNKMCDSVVEQIDLMATVANAFSQFAQLPERKDEVFNLNKEMVSLIQFFDDDSIYFHAGSENIMINMDKIYLRRILTNLITNAQQARDETRPSIINVDLEQIQKRIVIRVEDNGMGIPIQMKDKVFLPNFTSKNSGMGLGLPMVRRMVEDYKGEVYMKSEEGKGACFTIILPSNVS